jgi:hypothetical protein
MPGMSYPRVPAAKGVVAFALVAIGANALLRILPLPGPDLPSIPLPEIPGWVHSLITAKNWIVLGVVALVLVAMAIEQLGTRRARRGDDR